MQFRIFLPKQGQGFKGLQRLTYTQIWSSTPPPGFTRSPHQEHNIPALKLGNSTSKIAWNFEQSKS